MNPQDLAVSIIADSGDSRSYSLEALECIKNEKFNEANELLEKSDEALLKAHKTHTELLIQEAQGEKIPFSMFLLHSESHMNMAELTKEYVTAIKDVYLKKE